MLIEKLGVDYANASLAGTYFLYNGKPARISRVSYGNVMIRMLDDFDESLVVGHDVFSGWKTLKYPRLGYRRFDNGLWGNVQRAARSYTRGLNQSNTFVEPTPWLCSNSGIDWAEDVLGINPHEIYGDSYVPEEALGSVMAAALDPVYDGAEMFAKLLKKEEKCFIPSSRYLIEPLPDHTTFLGVYMSGTLVGRLDYDLNIYGPKKNTHIIQNMVKRYAA